MPSRSLLSRCDALFAWARQHRRDRLERELRYRYGQYALLAQLLHPYEAADRERRAWLNTALLGDEQ